MKPPQPLIASFCISILLSLHFPAPYAENVKIEVCPTPSAGVENPNLESAECSADVLEGASALATLQSFSAFAAASPVISSPISGVTIQEINPDQSTLDPTDPDGASAGRVNGLASVAGDNQTLYAASEWGGLYKSTDGGLKWSFLNGHRPVVTWDVEVDSSNTARVYATSFYDGRIAPLSGINVSTDSGATWSRPSFLSWGAVNCATNRQNEPSAFGIGIRPDATNNVFIGTNCGVAISTDSGATWNFVNPDPTPGDVPTNVWDVVVQAGGVSGIVDICGDDGHYRSTDGGTTWTGGAAALPGGRCSITASPDESYVLFVVAADNNIYESNDAGATWTNLGRRNAQGRIPFVQTNQRSNSGGNNIFDLWYGDVRLFRGSCTTPAAPAQGGANRCGLPATWAGPFTRTAGAHDDAGDIVFDTEAANDACPRVFSSDGGVYYNTDSSAATCQTPQWEQPTITPHVQWLFAMDGADQAGDNAEDLYYGTQDIGSFATTDAGAASPTWANQQCCDVFDVAADSNRVVYSVCCFGGGGRANRLFLRNPGMTGGGEINTYPSNATLPGFTPIDIVATFGDKKYVVVDRTPGVYITNNITANPIVWTQLGANLANACGVEVGVDGGTGIPTFYVQAGTCNERTMGNTGDQLWKFVGTGAGSWTQIDTNLPNSLGVGIFAVNSDDPNRLYASNIRSVANGGPQMMFSTDGGMTWSADAGLDTRMTGGGVFNYRTERGPGNFTPRFVGYPQPTLVAFDPDDPDILVAGGRDSGLFLSRDGGVSWNLVTDPFTSDTSGIPHLPRPWFAYFDDEPEGFVGIYIGTQGRGVWRLTLELPRISVVKKVDAEPDGVFDDDPSGWTFDVDDDGNPVQVTNGTGTLEFIVPPGARTYEVKEVDQPVGDTGLWLSTASCVDDDDGNPVGTGVMDQLFGPTLEDVTVSGVSLLLGQSVTCTFENQKMAGFMTGGGNIRTSKGRRGKFITFGGNAGIAFDGSLHGQWQTRFHNVGNDNLDNTGFHSTSIDAVVFGNDASTEPPDPPTAVFNLIHISATGRLDGLICTLSVDATDHGEPAGGRNAGVDSDSIRLVLDCPGTDHDYDSGADFSQEEPVDLHNLDGGDLQIHPPKE
jgi:photosystem II stability/assembly factor-like uncharacterized protein